MLGESCKGLSDKLKDKKNRKFIYILSPIPFLVLHMLCSINGMLSQSISFANSIVVPEARHYLIIIGFLTCISVAGDILIDKLNGIFF